MNFAKYFDHTILKPDATKMQVEKICKEAKQYGCASVCVNSFYTNFVAEQLKETGIAVCTVVGFPLGQMSTIAKCAETTQAVLDGANEIDMVINVGALKDGEYEIVREDISSVKRACGKGVLLKVILETCLLTSSEIQKACELSKDAGADFVKTSTGFSTAGAKVSDVALMRKTVGTTMGVKASGGIHTAKEARDMIEAGANRLGTSATVAILEEQAALL